MKRKNGFTLVELLITIVVGTILLAMSVPAFMDFIKNNRVTAQANELVSAIQLARNEALKRGLNVAVCASSDGATCTGSGTWASGWIVFSDFDPTDGDDPVVGADDPPCEETEDCVLLVNDGLSGGNTLTTASDDIRYLPTGLPDTGATAVLKLVSRDCEQNQARDITINPQGHTIVTKAGCT